ncbi:MAG: M24 family metallopeptidase [Puniceicoccaceae bacterium]
MKRKRTQSKTEPEVLLYAASEYDADALYFGGAFVPDPFIAFSCKGKRVAVLSQLEIARVAKEGRFDELVSLEELVSKTLAKTSKEDFLYPGSLIQQVAKEFGIRSFKISGTFPAGPLFQLQKLGFKVELAEGMLFPEREFKIDQEAAMIREGNAASSAGFKVVEKLLRESDIRKGWLYHAGKKLTSELVQQAIAIECLKRGAIAENTIVAGGDQACDPHCRGNGPLKANSFIIVDIFPKISATGFHGDMTRTYLKGKPSDAQRDLYKTVFDAQQEALVAHRAGRSGAKIFNHVKDTFDSKGYLTEIRDGVPVGFIHGLGHGLGLEIHEPPRVNKAGQRLRKGQVITVEPGLYYPGLGGVRVEDVVRVNAGEPEMLSKHSYRWHIR